MTSVVIVDDEIDSVEVLKDYFEISDIQVVAIGHNGQEAIELCIKHSPDFLVLDLRMPKFDGMYTLEKLLDENNSIKVLVVTGFIDEEDKSNIEKYKISKVFMKPTDPKDIVNFIKNN